MTCGRARTCRSPRTAASPCATTFPLDGEYVFAIRLKRNETIETIDGIAENEHQIEIRIDHALVDQFAIGGRYPGPDPGSLIAVPEDDVEGQRLHEYRMTADRALEVRVPVEAGTRLLSVAFTDSAPLAASPRGCCRASTRCSSPGRSTAWCPATRPAAGISSRAVRRRRRTRSPARVRSSAGSRAGPTAGPVGPDDVEAR